MVCWRVGGLEGGLVEAVEPARVRVEMLATEGLWVRFVVEVVAVEVVEVEEPEPGRGGLAGSCAAAEPGRLAAAVEEAREVVEVDGAP